jgi:hypothetical protein
MPSPGCRPCSWRWPGCSSRCRPARAPAGRGSSAARTAPHGTDPRPVRQGCRTGLHRHLRSRPPLRQGGAARPRRPDRRGLRRQGARRHDRYPRPVHRQRDTRTRRLVRSRVARLLHGLAVGADSISRVPPDPAYPANRRPDATDAPLAPRSGLAVSRCPAPRTGRRAPAENLVHAGWSCCTGAARRCTR